MDSDVNTLPAMGDAHFLRRRTASGSFHGSTGSGSGSGSRRGMQMMMRAASFGSLHQHAYDDDDDDTDPAMDEMDDDEDDEHALLLEAKLRASAGRESGDYDDTSALLQPPIHVRRRRFHSSDVVVRPAAGSFHPPRGGPDSPTMALRQWLARGGSELSPAQLRLHRQHRRAQSTDFTTRQQRPRHHHDHGMRRSFEIGNRPSSHYHNAIAEEIFRDGGAHDEDEEDDDGTVDGNHPHHDHDGLLLDSESDQEDIDEAGSDTDNDDHDHDHASATRSHRAGSGDSNGSAASFYSNAVDHSYESAPYDDPPSVEKLLNLQKLYQEGFITVTEYKNRRLQLVDELTVSNANQTINRTTDLIQRDLPVIHRDPPDFTVLRERDAIKHIFDSEKRKWTSARIKVKIDPQPFARGGLRQVFHLQDLSVIPRLGHEGRPVSYVAKIAIDIDEDPDTYFKDVEMQAVASKFAKVYNSYNPPRRVEFLDAWILQLIPPSKTDEDEDNLTMRGTICGVEPYIAGDYHKHNNNFGYVSELERNTPQAFSHFTYEASGQQMLIVDIQGVADHYTDPQIHTRSGKEFGKGNLSTRGFERFLESHRCNPICRYLKLPLGNENDQNLGGTQNGTKNDGRGTVPAQTYMSQPRIKRVDSELVHYYGDSTAFKKYQAKHNQQNHGSAGADAASAFVAALKEQRHCSTFCGVGLCTIS